MNYLVYTGEIYLKHSTVNPVLLSVAALQTQKLIRSSTNSSSTSTAHQNIWSRIHGRDTKYPCHLFHAHLAIIKTKADRPCNPDAQLLIIQNLTLIMILSIIHFAIVQTIDQQQASFDITKKHRKPSSTGDRNVQSELA